MSKFQSRAVIIDAVQLTRQRAFDYHRGVELLPNGLVMEIGSRREEGDILEFWCHTRQGDVQAELDDWIIQESDGSGCYPCKPDVFEARYEPLQRRQ